MWPFSRRRVRRAQRLAAPDSAASSCGHAQQRGSLLFLNLKSSEKASELNMIAERHLESNDPNQSNLESTRHGMSRHLPAPPRSLLLALSECPCMHDRCTRAPLAVCARTARCRLAAAPDIRDFAGVGDAERDALCADGLHAHVHRLLLRVSALSMRGTGHADAARLLQSRLPHTPFALPA